MYEESEGPTPSRPMASGPEKNRYPDPVSATSNAITMNGADRLRARRRAFRCPKIELFCTGVTSGIPVVVEIDDMF